MRATATRAWPRDWCRSGRRLDRLRPRRIHRVGQAAFQWDAAKRRIAGTRDEPPGVPLPGLTDRAGFGPDGARRPRAPDRLAKPVCADGSRPSDRAVPDGSGRRRQDRSAQPGSAQGRRKAPLPAFPEPQVLRSPPGRRSRRRTLTGRGRQGGRLRDGQGRLCGRTRRCRLHLGGDVLLGRGSPGTARPPHPRCRHDLVRRFGHRLVRNLEHGDEARQNPASRCLRRLPFRALGRRRLRHGCRRLHRGLRQFRP